MPDGLGETLVAVIRTARHPSEIPSAMRRPTVDSRRTSARLAKMAGEAWLNLRQRQTGCESSRHALGRGCHSTGRSEAGQTPVAQQTGGGAVAPRGMTGIRPSHRVNVSEEIERSCRCFCRRATGVCRHPAGAGTPFALLHTRRDDRARKVSESRGTGYGDEELRRVLLTTRGGASYLDPSWGERRGWRACRGIPTSVQPAPRAAATGAPPVGFVRESASNEGQAWRYCRGAAGRVWLRRVGNLRCTR